MQLASQIYGYDVQQAVGLASGMAGYYGDLGYGRDAANVNLEGTKYNADKNLEGTKYNADKNYASNIEAAKLNAAKDFVMNKNIAEGQFGAIEQMFGIPAGSLKEAPMNTYSGGGSGSYYSGGSGSYYSGANTNSTPFDPDKINSKQYSTSTALQKKALAVGNKSNYVGAATTLGYSVADAEAAWETAREVMWQKAQELDRDAYIAWRKAQYGTDQYAGSWRKYKPIIKSDTATQYNRVQQGVDSLGRIGGYY